MLAALLVPLVAVTIGTSLARLGGAQPGILLPIRAFALAAVVTAVSLHLLPEALAGAGLGVLAAFAAGLWLPMALARSRGARDRLRHRRLASELSFLAVLAHQVSDGLALGALGSGLHAGHSHWDVLLGIAAHTVPLAAVVTLPFASSTRQLIWRAGLLIAASALGVLGADWLSALHYDAMPWLSATVAGTLLHLLAHDEPPLARPDTLRLFEVGAVIFGAALPVALSSEHSLPALAALTEAATAAAPALLVGLIGALLLPHLAASWPQPRSALLAGWLDALRAPACSCQLEELAGKRPAPASRRVVAYSTAAPELHPGTLLLTAWLFGPAWAALRLALGLALSALLAGLARTTNEATPAPAAAPVPWSERLAETLVHVGPWLAAGLVITAWLTSSSLAPALAALDASLGPYGLAVVIVTISVVAYVCAWAATPVAAALLAAGVSPALAVAALVLGSLGNRRVLAALRPGLRRGGLLVALAGALGVALLATALAPYLPVLSALPRAPRALEVATALILAAAALYSLWRHGLTAWLEPLLASGHHHHQHEETEPCGDGCHHDFAMAPALEPEAHHDDGHEPAQGHGHHHDHGAHHGHDHGT